MPEGRGFHSLCGHGTRLELKKEHLGALFKGRTGIIFSPFLSRMDVYTYLPKNILFFNHWVDVIRFITENEKRAQKVAIFPTAPLQLPK
jgi:hypothetical protein